MIDLDAVHDFLAQRRIAIIGASWDPLRYSNIVYEELRDHGYDVIAVHPRGGTLDGDPCYPDVASVPGAIDGAVIMVNHARAADIVRECAARGIPRVWLFEGLGGSGSLSDAAVEVAREHGMELVAGACPLMFLEPAGGRFRLHRLPPHAYGALRKAS